MSDEAEDRRGATDASVQEEAEARFLRCLSLERRRLHHFIYSLVPNMADAEDVFQQTTVTMWKRFSDYDQERDFYAWACGVAYHTALNFRRAAKRKRLLFSDELVQLIADERVAGAERSRHRLDLLQDCLALLPERDRELVRSVYEDGSSAREIAERLGKAVQTIHNRLSKVRLDLLNCIERKASSQAWRQA